MAVVRRYRTDVDGTVGVKVRRYRTDVDGTALTVPKVRIYRTDVDGTAAVLLAPIANQTVEPETVVTVSTSITTGQTADSWTWRRISGATVTLTGTGGTRTLRAPSGMPPTGASVTLGVTATSGGVTSPEQVTTVTGLPQLEWYWTGTQWVGKPPRVQL